MDGLRRAQAKKRSVQPPKEACQPVDCLGALLVREPTRKMRRSEWTVVGSTTCTQHWLQCCHDDELQRWTELGASCSGCQCSPSFPGSPQTPSGKLCPRVYPVSRTYDTARRASPTESTLENCSVLRSGGRLFLDLDAWKDSLICCADGFNATRPRGGERGSRGGSARALARVASPAGFPPDPQVSRPYGGRHTLVTKRLAWTQLGKMQPSRFRRHPAADAQVLLPYVCTVQP